MMERLLNKRVGYAFSGGLLVVAGFVWYYWSAVYAFCRSMGDVASVFGLVLGLLGFVITIATLLDIRRISERARAETRRVVSGAIQRVAHVLLSTETLALLRLVSSIRTGCGAGQWAEAVVLGREAQLATSQALGNPLLLDPEKQVIRDAGLDLHLIVRYIESKRLTPTPPPQGAPFQPLSGRHINKLDAIVVARGEIHARLRQQALEVPDAYFH